jgi:hypothetical protein
MFYRAEHLKYWIERNNSSLALNTEIIPLNLKEGATIGIIPVIVIAIVFGSYFDLAIPASSNSMTVRIEIVPIKPSGELNSSTLGLSSAHQGLELRVKINSTALLPSQNLGINVSLINLLPTTNMISTPTSPVLPFRVIGFPIAMWGPCYSTEPIEFIVVKGNYSLSELEYLSQNTPSPAIMCMEGGTLNQIFFYPNNDTANITGTMCTATCRPIEPTMDLSSNFTISGYWVYPLNQSETQDVFTPVTGTTCSNSTSSWSCGITFNYPEVGPIPQAKFSDGPYTLVVCDEWGQTVILHFEVNSNV